MSVPLPRLRRRYRTSEPQKEEDRPAGAAASSDKIKDVVSFLTLILELDIHIFSSSIHSKTQPSRTGAGATFSVGQFKLHFNGLGFDETDTYEDGNVMRGGGTSYGDVVVMKRIATSRYGSGASGIDYASTIRPLVQELRVLSHPCLRSHQNIIDLFGVAWEQQLDRAGHCWPIVVLEYADHGNIYDFLASEEVDKHWLIRLGFCNDMINGLCALHNAGVMHADLKGENTLIFRQHNGKFVAKLCDFGFAIVEDDYEDPVAVIYIPGLTPRWAAPELRYGFVSLAQAHMADIYALGLLLTIVIQNGISPFSVNGTDLTLTEIQKLQQKNEIGTFVTKSLPVYLESGYEVLADTIRGTLANLPTERYKLALVKQAFRDVDPTEACPMESAPEEDVSFESAASSSSADLEDERLHAIFEDGDDLFPAEPTTLENMWDLPLLVQKEVQNDLERRANEQPSEMSEEDKLRKQFLWGKAAYLLFILVQNWQGIQDSNSGMRWLIRAASNGYFAGRAELPRVVAATDFQLSEDLQAAMSDWLHSCIPFYQDRFILDTIEDMNPLSYHQLDDRVRASWATGPFLPGLFGDEWLFALYNAITEYCSVAHVFENSYTTLSDYFGAVYSAIQGNTMTLLEFLFTPSANSGESRLYKDYGNGLTWVHFCAVIGLIEVFQHAGFDPGTIDTQDNLGRTALYFATVCGNSHAVLCLLELGADGSLGCDDKGNTILHFANIFRRGDIAKVVELLIESGADVNALNNKLETPIHKVIQGTFSARSNYVALMALLDRGADPSLCDVDGDVAHCWAITTLQAKSLELLLRGIKTKLSSPDLLLLKADLLDRFMCVPQSEKLALAGPEYPACIDSILQLVVDEETFEIFKELPDNNGDSAFFSASFRAAADIMTSLRKLWPSVDIDECEHEYGRPPLCYAIRHGKQTIFDLLVDLGADISYQENTQENALHAAAEYAPAMLEKILDVCHSANCLDKMVKTISSHGHTPFDTAVINGHINAARLLSKYGVDLNSARCIGYGGIHTTTLGYILQIPATSVAEVAFLLDLGSQGVVSKDLSSVFHALATRRNELQDEEATEFDGESSSMSIFDLLLHHFPEAVHQKNNYGETPLHIACRSVRRDIVTRLLDLGTAVNATDNRGRTAEDEIMDQKRVGGSSFAHLLPRRRFFQQIDEIEELLSRAK